ncbi:pro-adrenomedullin [Alosa pseudoharengus]|uniref:pro-adrenomedullin n=1 Tax=Alosa pseudoharengus TaxID=34774 RepID=UPI003F89F6C5
MKLFLQSVVILCVLATLVRCSRNTHPEPSAEGRKRLSVWLQSLVRRDVHRRLSVREEDSVNNLEESRSNKPLISHLRIKRTLNSMKPLGCNLVTCSIHDLAHRLHGINKQKSESAPQHKIGANGYGRRRRRSLEQLFPSLSSQRSQGQRSGARSSSRRATGFRRT